MILVRPETLKIFPQQITSDRFQVVSHQLSRSHCLLSRQILRSFQQARASAFQNRLVAIPLQLSRFLSMYFIDRFIHRLHDVEAIEDIDRTRDFLCQHCHRVNLRWRMTQGEDKAPWRHDLRPTQGLIPKKGGRKPPCVSPSGLVLKR